MTLVHVHENELELVRYSSTRIVPVFDARDY
jgi:hypothetical protein